MGCSLPVGGEFRGVVSFAVQAWLSRAASENEARDAVEYGGVAKGAGCEFGAMQNLQFIPVRPHLNFAGLLQRFPSHTLVPQHGVVGGEIPHSTT